jgi:hypothetical protein
MPGFLLGDPFLHLTIVQIAMLVTTGNGESPASGYIRAADI